MYPMMMQTSTNNKKIATFCDMLEDELYRRDFFYSVLGDHVYGAFIEEALDSIHYCVSHTMESALKTKKGKAFVGDVSEVLNEVERRIDCFCLEHEYESSTPLSFQIDIKRAAFHVHFLKEDLESIYTEIVNVINKSLGTKVKLADDFRGEYSYAGWLINIGFANFSVDNCIKEIEVLDRDGVDIICHVGKDLNSNEIKAIKAIGIGNGTPVVFLGQDGDYKRQLGEYACTVGDLHLELATIAD